MKDLSSVIHLYLGCDVINYYPKEDKLGTKIYSLEQWNQRSKVAHLARYHDGKVQWTMSELISGFKLVLKRLSDMTEEDAIGLCKIETPERRWPDIEVHDISHCDVHFTDGSKWHGDGVEELNDLYVHLDSLNPQQFIYLLSKGYWLFDQSAFDNGLIIDAKTL